MRRTVRRGVLLLLLPLLACCGLTRVRTGRQVVALTFDDGPNPPYTDQLLQVLEEKQVKATFFLIGKQIAANPELARRIILEGHEVGGHSNDWTPLAFKSRKYVEHQLDQMEMAFAHIGVTNLALFRPPNGLLSPGQDRILRARDLQHISADIVVGDWRDIDFSTIRDRVVMKARPGSIIVLHDGGGDRSASVAAVPLIVDDLRRQGYTFVTVSEMLAMQHADRSAR